MNCGFGYQVACEAVCESGSARIGDERSMAVTTAGGRHEEVAQDYLVRFADAYDREVQAWVDATRAAGSPDPGSGTGTRRPPSPRRESGRWRAAAG